MNETYLLQKCTCQLSPVKLLIIITQLIAFLVTRRSLLAILIVKYGMKFFILDLKLLQYDL